MLLTLKLSKMFNYKKDRIRVYHKEEVVYMLNILSSNLSEYSDEELELFAEHIEGRISVLFQQIVLNSLGFSKIDKSMLHKFFKLKDMLNEMFSSNWHVKLGVVDERTRIIKSVAQDILKTLEIDYENPIDYSKTHLNTDW